jgi:hypothetical protein
MEQCHRCLLGPLDVKVHVHNRQVHVPHVCPLICETLVDFLESLIETNDPDGHLPYNALIIDDLVLNTAARYYGKLPFRSLTVTNPADPRVIETFMNAYELEQCTMWKYTERERKLEFHMPVNTVQLFWTGWFSKWKVEKLVAHAVDSASQIRISGPPMRAVLDALQVSLSTLHLSSSFWQANAVILDMIVEHFHASLQVLECPGFHFGLDMISLGWPRLKTTGASFDAHVSSALLAEHLPNLICITGAKTALKSIQLTPHVAIIPESSPVLHIHMAKVQWRNAMMLHFYKHVRQLTGVGDLASVMTQEYAHHLHPIDDADPNLLPFLYPNGTRPLNEPHHKHLYAFQEEEADKAINRELALSRRIVHKKREELDTVEFELRQREREYSEKVTGKRKRLYQKVQKLKEKRDKLQRIYDQHDAAISGEAVFVQLRKDARLAYLRSYVGNLLHLEHVEELKFSE